MVVLLIGNKSGIETRAVKSADVIKYAETHKLAYIETSAKDGTNVDAAFSLLVTEVYKLLKATGQFNQPTVKLDQTR